MPTYSFRAVLAGNVDVHLDDLFEAGCGDATFGVIDGVPYADFCREAATLNAALTSAALQIESVSGLALLYVEDGQQEGTP